ncbi:MAG: hypothetical protein ACREBW_05205 [Candidatus Micrarchaeaceae archaeon]
MSKSALSTLANLNLTLIGTTIFLGPSPVETLHKDANDESWYQGLLNAHDKEPETQRTAQRMSSNMILWCPLETLIHTSLPQTHAQRYTYEVASATICACAPSDLLG